MVEPVEILKGYNPKAAEAELFWDKIDEEATAEEKASLRAEWQPVVEKAASVDAWVVRVDIELKKLGL